MGIYLECYNGAFLELGLHSLLSLLFRLIHRLSPHQNKCLGLFKTRMENIDSLTFESV